MTLKEYMGLICIEKDFVLKLSKENLKKYKNNFYSQNYKMWQLDLLWEYIWGDIDYPTMYYIFKRNKLI